MLFRYALLSLFLISCGSRKAEVKKDVTTNDVKTETVTEVKEQVKFIDTTFIDEFEIYPLIDSIPIVINGVTYKNARLTYKKTKVNKIYTKDKTTRKNEQKHDKTQRKLFIKETERSSMYWPFIVFVILICIFFYLKRKTDI